MLNVATPREEPTRQAWNFTWPAWALRWWERRHRISDWLWAGVVFVVAIPWQALPDLGLLSEFSERVVMTPQVSPRTLIPLVLLILGIPAVMAIPVLFRRSRPGVLLGVATVVLVFFGNPVLAAFGIFSYAAWFPRGGRLTLWTVVTMVSWIIAVDGWPRTAAGAVGITMMMLAIFVLPMGFGLWIGTRRDLIRSLRERAERLEREQDLLAASAAAEERTRIAREMHDVVAHRVSLMVLHAGGLEVSAPDEKTAGTAETIRRTGREALTELRDILGVLRAETDRTETAPQPGLGDINRLVGDWQAAGMSINLRDEQTGDLTTTIGRTAYRVVQEGLTNCAKHAPAADVEVHVRNSDAMLIVTVTNGPSGTTGIPAAPTSGYGLSGLTERIAVLGGTLTWCPTPTPGWTLRAEIPTTAT